MTTSGDQLPASPSGGTTKGQYFIIIGALLVVIILLASYILISVDIFGSEYPREDTPLELQPWGLTWTMEWNEIIDEQVGFSYSSMELRMMYPVRMGGTGWSMSLGDYTRMNFTLFSAPSTPELAAEQFRATTTIWGPGLTAESVGFFITDDPDDGRFNSGDRICVFRVVYDETGNISRLGFDEDIVYQIGWRYSEGGIEMKAAYEFAIDDGKLYSWLYSRQSDLWDM